MFSVAFLKSQPSDMLAIPLWQFSFSNSFPFRNPPFNLFSPFSNLPPALSLQQFIFPSAILFPSKASHIKSLAFIQKPKIPNPQSPKA
jgi:hypothetical protein